MTKIYSKLAYAELLGMHAGDGTIYRNKKYLVFELRGNLDEKEMYDNTVTSLVHSAFRITLRPKFRAGGKNGCYGVRLCNQEIINKIVKSGFPIGPKSSNVKIPNV